MGWLPLTTEILEGATGTKHDSVIHNQEFRFCLGRKCRELLGGGVVLRHERVKTFGHFSVQLEGLRIVNQNVAAITRLDCLVRRTRVA